ncbi:MAG: uroporphyrinogen-III synthase [Bacteroidaceae bacterium]|nr:uroporphyrinogen-III synthase [Bacteroidaceae bacterium]
MIKKILISQPAPASSTHNPYSDFKSSLGVDVVFHPLIKVEPVTEREFRNQKVDISSYNAIVFSSRYSIDYFFHVCKLMRVTPPVDMKYFGISEQVMLYIQKYVQYRKRKVFFSPTGRWEDLMPAMLKHKASRFLIPQNNEHKADISTLMKANGLNFTESVMYRTVPNTLAEGSTLSDFDALVLFTSSGVKSLVSSFPDWEQGNTRLICFGDSACRAVANTSLRLDYSPRLRSGSSVAKELEAYINKVNAAV